MSLEGECCHLKSSITMMVTMVMLMMMMVLIVMITTSKAARAEAVEAASVSTYITAPRCRQRARACRAPTNGSTLPILGGLTMCLIIHLFKLFRKPVFPPEVSLAAN